MAGPGSTVRFPELACLSPEQLSLAPLGWVWPGTAARVALTWLGRFIPTCPGLACTSYRLLCITLRPSLEFLPLALVAHSFRKL